MYVMSKMENRKQQDEKERDKEKEGKRWWKEKDMEKESPWVKCFLMTPGLS